jgi:hypothetical protein
MQLGHMETGVSAFTLARSELERTLIGNQGVLELAEQM